MGHQMEYGDSNSEKKKQLSWFSRQSCALQFCLIFVPLAVLLTAVIVLGVLLAEEMNNNVTPAASGQILANMDLKADPCQDFYQYTCGGYERQQNIPSGYSKYGAFDKCRNLVDKDVRAILENESPPANEAQARNKSRTYYHACLDTDAIAANGPPALFEMVTKLQDFHLTGASTLPAGWSLIDLLDRRNNYTIDGLFTFYVSQDYKNVSTHIIEVSQGGLGLGSGTREYYLNKTESDAQTLAAYADLLTTYAQLIVGETQVDKKMVHDVVDFEQRLARISMSNSEMRDPSALYNNITVSQLQDISNINGFSWLTFFQNAFKAFSQITIEESEPVLLTATPYIGNLTTVLNEYLSSEDGRKTIHNYIVFRAVSAYAPSFGGEFQAAYDKFQGIFAGQQGSLQRWQICVGDTNDVVGFGLGAIYVDDTFSEDGKAMAEEVINDVSVAFRERIVAVDWMDAQTKEAALRKVDALTYEAAYPQWIKNDTYLDIYYSKLKVVDNYVANQFAAYTFFYDQSFSALKKGPDPDVWYMNPQTVNAYYSPTQNKFVVPAGILSPPFFYQSRELPKAVNYAAIGTVTGHEIGHGFDDSGSQFDGDGNLNNWWSEETLEAFTEKGDCLVKQYDNYEVDGLHLNGKQTLGENIGDNGGLRASYQAYDTAVQAADRKRLVGLDLTPEQLFFVSYAQVWCSLYTPESMELQIKQNVHSPGNFRVIGPVSNSPEFADAFRCPKNSPMNPDDKCTVW